DTAGNVAIFPVGEEGAGQQVNGLGVLLLVDICLSEDLNDVCAAVVGGHVLQQGDCVLAAVILDEDAGKIAIERLVCGPGVDGHAIILLSGGQVAVCAPRDVAQVALSSGQGRV